MAGIITQGTTFGISVDGVAYSELGVIQSFSLSATARNEIETTGLLDTTKTYEMGLKDSPTISVELLYDPTSAGQVLLDASYSSNTPYKFEIEFSDIITPITGNGTTKTFEGYVMSQNTDSSSDEVLRQSVEIKVSGDITTVDAT